MSPLYHDRYLVLEIRFVGYTLLDTSHLDPHLFSQAFHPTVRLFDCIQRP